MYKTKIFFIISVLMFSFTTQAVLLNQIIAIVEDDVILEHELNLELKNIVKILQTKKVMIPPVDILKKQVLERLIIYKLQLQLAKKLGISVDDEMLRKQIYNLAANNNLNVVNFKQELARQGVDFQSFKSNMKSEIIINSLRAKEIGSKIKVTDSEVNHYLETQDGLGKEKIQYRLGHILIATSNNASPEDIKQAQKKANNIISNLQKGADFKQTAVAVSAGGNALKGGDLGWRELAQIPTLFVASIRNMNQGEITELIRSPSGFHIIKMLGLKGIKQHSIMRTKMRHILIKTNVLINDEEAKKKLLTLKTKILNGDDFAKLAKSNSDDKSSAINGGDLGWVEPGNLMPVLENAMNQSTINTISDPVHTEFGWHIIQVQQRENKNDSIEYSKKQVRREIRKRKIEEKIELWLLRLRNKAYVNIMLDKL